MALTVTPGMMSPEVSKTFPLIFADWAKPTVAVSRINPTTKSFRIRIDVIPPLTPGRQFHLT